MTWSVGRARWVGALTDPEIAQQVGTRTFERGRAYAEQLRVRSLASRPDGLMLLGTVQGSSSDSYQAIITARPHPRGRTHLWSGRCSCPVANDCKHVVALLLLARDVSNGVVTDVTDVTDERLEAGRAPADALARPHWSDVIHLPTARPAVGPERPTPRTGELAAGIFFDTIYVDPGGRGRAPQRGVGLRPTRFTKTRTWHRSLSWHEALPQWHYGPRYLPEHARVMSAIHDAGRVGGTGGTQFFTSVVPVRLDASPRMWSLLGEARDLGVELLAGEGLSGPVRVVDEAATPVLHIDRADDGSGDLGLHIALTGLPDAPGEATYLGDPVHGLLFEPDEGGLVLVPVEQSLGLDAAGLREAMAGLRVPAGERAEFLRTVYPSVRRTTRVRSQVPLPVLPDVAAETADRVVTVRVVVRGDIPGEVRLTLGYAYDGPGGRDLAAESAALAGAGSLLLVPGAVTSDAGGQPQLVQHVTLTGASALGFGLKVLPALEADEHVTVEVDGELTTYEELTGTPVVHLGTDDAGREDGRTDWFDLSITIEVDGEAVPISDLITAFALGLDVILLESGGWFRLDRPELHRLRELVAEAQELVDPLVDPASQTLRLSAHHVDLWEELTALGVVEHQSARWTASVEALRSEVAVPPPPVPADLRATLRPYQLEGYHWLSRLWDAGVGGILADDMGLGKTLQIIAVLARAHERGELGPLVSVPAAEGHGPVLVVAPTSVVGTWLGELATFAPHLAVVAVAETTRKRGTPLTEAVGDAQVVVTSYAVLRLDEDAFREVGWGGVVLDEAQFVKNRQAKTHVAARRLGAPFTVAVTGTPVENSLMDLWSLLSLTAPGLYPRPDVFTKNYRKPIESGSRPELLDHLRRRIRPLMLRRTKEQVALDLPPKHVQLVPVPLHPIHGHVYDQHLARERQRVLGLLGDPEANRVAILASLTRLRQLALDPALVDPAHDGKARAAKIDYLVEQLRELAAEGHRALVFSQFTGFLRRVETALEAAGLRSCYLDGATKDRQQVIRSFRDGQAAAFLISLKAGGFGLTLTEADYVFVLDPWWNPAAEEQAIDRTHRIGQTRPVTVYRLVSAGTIEEKVVALQERKRDLFQRVVDDGGALSGAITADDVRALLDLSGSVTS